MFKDQDQAPQHTLAAGQSLQFWGKRGSTLQIEGGRAYLTEPGLWLSGPAQLEPVRLLNGHGHILRRSGWVVIYAALPCQLTVVAAPARASWGTRLLALLRRPVQACSGCSAWAQGCHQGLPSLALAHSGMIGCIFWTICIQSAHRGLYYGSCAIQHPPT